MSAWTIPGRDLSRRIAWQLLWPQWRFMTPENGGSFDGKYHAVNAGQRYIGGTLGGLMDQLEMLAQRPGA